MLLPERDVRTPGVGASGSTRARALNPTIPDPEQLVLRTTSLSCIPCFMMLPGFLRDIPEIYISRTTFGGSISASFLNSFNVTTALDYSWNSLKGNCQYTSIFVSMPLVVPGINACMGEKDGWVNKLMGKKITESTTDVNVCCFYLVTFPYTTL